MLGDVGEHFRINGGDARAIAGISSGGYAAINLALKYPGLFFFAGSLSGAVTAPRDPEYDKAFKSFRLHRHLWSADSKTRKENDVFLLAEKAEPQHTTFIFMACGRTIKLSVCGSAFFGQQKDVVSLRVLLSGGPKMSEKPKLLNAL